MMIKKTLLILALVAFAAPALADTLAKTFDGIPIMGGASNPLTNALIADNFSHDVSLKDTKSKKLTWFNMNYNGSGTCILRIMNNTTRSSWPAFPVTSGVPFGRVVHSNATYLNYSGCVGTTATVSGTGNSILELQ